MPTSESLQLASVIEVMIRLDPRSVLDVGVGFGKYGVLAREYLDVGQGFYRDWKRRIDGVEGYRDYITPLHDYVYDEIFIGNATEIVPALLRRYDLVLLIDVIEHLTKEEGLKLLRDCLSIGRNVLVGTPKAFIEQGSAFGNEYETHKSLWHPSDFAGVASMCQLAVPEDVSLVVFLGEDAEVIRRGMRGWRRRLRESIPLLFKPYLAMRRRFLVRR